MSHGLLFLRLGGARVASLAHQTLSVPTLSTLCYGSAANSTVTSLSPSAGFPTHSKVQSNLRAAFKKSRGDSGCGYVIMIDEIKVEERLRWDPSTNKIMGLCREHTEHVGLDFCSISNARAVVHGILQGEIHHASEVCRLSVDKVSIANKGACSRRQSFRLESFQRIGMRRARCPSSLWGPANGSAVTDMCSLYPQSLRPVTQRYQQ